MEKTYIAPSIYVVELSMETHLLAGSEFLPVGKEDENIERPEDIYAKEHTFDLWEFEDE